MKNFLCDRSDPTFGQEWSYCYLKGRVGTVGDDRYASPPILNSTDFAAHLACEIRGAQMMVDGEDFRTNPNYRLPPGSLGERYVYSASNRPADIFSSFVKIDCPGTILHYTARRGYSPAPYLLNASYTAPDGRRMDERTWLRETDQFRPKPVPYENPSAPTPDYVLNLFGWRITFTRTYAFGDNHVYRSEG